MRTLVMALIALLLFVPQIEAAPKKKPRTHLYLMSFESFPDARIEAGYLVLRPSPERKFGERLYGLGVEVEGGRWVESDDRIHLEVTEGSRAKIGFFSFAGWINPEKPRRIGQGNTASIWAFDGKRHREINIPLPGEEGYLPVIVISTSESQWQKDRDEAVKAALQEKKGKPSSASKR